MTRVGRSPADGKLFLTVWAVLCVLSVALTAGDLADAPLELAFALTFWLVLLPGGILLYISLTFRPIAYDPVAGTARLGRTTVPLESITTAKREVAATKSGVDVRYRFESTSGAWGRVLVVGTGSGSNDGDRQRLIQFVEATGLPETVDDDAGLSPRQRLMADNASRYGVKSAVGKRALLTELKRTVDMADVDDDVPQDARPRVGNPADDEGDWQADDAAAAVFLARRTIRGRRARRLFGVLTIVATVLGVGVVFVAAIAEQAAGGDGDLSSDTNDLISTGVLTAVAVGLPSYLGYCVATYQFRRGAQHAALEWLDRRGDDQAARGLPPALLEPFTKHPAHQLKTLAGFAAAMVGLAGLVGGPVMLSMGEDYSPVVGATWFVAGLVFGALSIALFVSVARAAARQQVLVVKLGGRRHLRHVPQW